MVKAMVIRRPRPASSTIPSASRLPLAKPRPGTPNTLSSAENSDPNTRRDVQASSARAGHWKRSARSTNVRSASRAGSSMCTTTPLMMISVPLYAASKDPTMRTPSEIRKIDSGSSDSSV